MRRRKNIGMFILNCFILFTLVLTPFYSVIAIENGENDEFTLIIYYEGNGVVTKNPDQTTYEHNVEVELTAIADSGWIFDHWNGDTSGSENPLNITMDDNKTIIACFSEMNDDDGNSSDFEEPYDGEVGDSDEPDDIALGDGDEPEDEEDEENIQEGEYEKDEEYNDVDDDDIDDEHEEYEERVIEIQKDGSEIKIRSEWEREDLEDEFEIQFSTDDELKIELEYSSKLNASENELEFIVLVEKIIEYNDTNGNGIFDENDTVVSTYILDDVVFNDIDYNVETTLDNETIHIFSTNTIDEVFGIVLYVVGGFAKFNSGTLSPSEIKIDFKLNYSYLNNDSLLALKVEVETEYETETNVDSYDETQGYASNESEISIKSGEYFGFFSWADYAIVDGVNMSINTKVSSEIDLEMENGEEELERKDIIYFCYPRGTSILHDPKIGVIGVSSLSFDKLQPILSIVETILIYVIALLVTTALIVGLIYLRKRM